MHVSTYTIRRTATLAVIATALAAIGAPVAHADRGFESPDALDRALIVATAEKTAMLDARERALIRSSSQDGNFRASPDVVERAVRAHQTAGVAEGPDVFERTATAGQLAYRVPATTANGFDWNDFGVGAALGAGALLLLGVIGVGLLVAHRRAPPRPWFERAAPNWALHSAVESAARASSPSDRANEAGCHSFEGREPPIGGGSAISQLDSLSQIAHLRQMNEFMTPESRAAPRAAEAVVLSYRQIVALALVACIPIPLLSLAATVVPLPQILERAAATFVPFVAPTLGDDEGRVARESASAVRALGIVHSHYEQTDSSLAPRAGPTRVGGGTRAGPSAPDPSLAPDGGPATQPSEGAPDSTPPGGTGEQGESPPSGADPTAPPAGGPPGDAPGGGNTDGQGAPNGSGSTPPGDAPGQASDHGKPGSPPGQGDPGPSSDPGGRNSGGSGNGSGQGTPPTSEPPTGGGASPGAGGRRP